MITLAWSDYGTVQGEFCLSVARSIKQDSQERNLIDGVFASQYATVSTGRNLLFNDFLEKTDSPWLLTIDADTMWSIEDVYKLYDIAVKNQVKVLSATYFIQINCTEGCLHTYPAMFFDAELDGVKHPGTIGIAEFIDKEVIEVDWTGLGALLIHRDVLEEAKEIDLKGSPSWCAETFVDGYFSGEDYYFFNNLKKKGNKIYATPQVRVGHIKRQLLDFESYKQEHGIS
jgi:hypothetical protein